MRAPLLLAACLVATGLTPGCASSPGPGTTVTVDTSFEDGLVGWTENSDVPDDPNRPGKQVAWNITSSTEQARTGDRGVAFELDGRQDDGTIWITQPIGIEPGQAYRANVSVWAWSVSESFNERAHLVMHLGTTAPTAEGDFPEPGTNTTADGNATRGGLRQPLDQAEGFKRYSFGWTLPAQQAREVYMSVGISAVWETELTFHIDDLTVDLTRLAAQPTDTGGQQDDGSPY